MKIKGVNRNTTEEIGIAAKVSVCYVFTCGKGTFMRFTGTANINNKIRLLTLLTKANALRVQTHFCGYPLNNSVENCDCENFVVCILAFCGWKSDYFHQKG